MQISLLETWYWKSNDILILLTKMTLRSQFVSNWFKGIKVTHIDHLADRLVWVFLFIYCYELFLKLKKCPTSLFAPFHWKNLLLFSVLDYCKFNMFLDCWSYKTKDDGMQTQSRSTFRQRNSKRFLLLHYPVLQATLSLFCFRLSTLETFRLCLWLIWCIGTLNLTNAAAYTCLYNGFHFTCVCKNLSKFKSIYFQWGTPGKCISVCWAMSSVRCLTVHSNTACKSIHCTLTAAAAVGLLWVHSQLCKSSSTNSVKSGRIFWYLICTKKERQLQITYFINLTSVYFPLFGRIFF